MPPHASSGSLQWQHYIGSTPATTLAVFTIATHDSRLATGFVGVSTEYPKSKGVRGAFRARAAQGNYFVRPRFSVMSRCMTSLPKSLDAGIAVS